MTTSYNGWPASPSLKTRPFAVMGIPFVGGIVNDPDVYTVLHQLMFQVANKVEKPKNPGCWGFSYRQNRNADNLSNHASGTAVDLNAPRNPNGVPASRTFTPKQIKTIHSILADFDNLVQWGGDYTGVPDSMHFDIEGTKAQIHKLAVRLRKGKKANPIKRAVKKVAAAKQAKARIKTMKKVAK